MIDRFQANSVSKAPASKLNSHQGNTIPVSVILTPPRPAQLTTNHKPH